MRLLNVGCGGDRVVDDTWINIDDLHSTLKPGTPERTNLDNEPNYINHDLLSGPLPFADESFDGVLIQHVLEHLSCHGAVTVLKECKRVMKVGASLIASVPDADYFLKAYPEDTKENAVRLFGEPIHDEWQPTFMSYALFHRDHVQILTGPALLCLFIQSGLAGNGEPDPEVETIMQSRLTRLKFSATFLAVKSS